MKKVAWIFLLIGFAMLIIGCGSTGKPIENKLVNIQHLISLLDSDDLQTRETAHHELIDIGEKLIKEYKQLKINKQEINIKKTEIEKLAQVLKESAKSNDPEIKMRVNSIQRHFYSLLGSKIAYMSYQNGHCEIYVMDTDGKNQTRLTENNGDNSEPAWAPDGSKIAFVSTRNGNSEIYVMDADGTNQTRLTENKAPNNYHPAWSPDGTKIAFFSEQYQNLWIYVMDADGKNQTSLKAMGCSPAWSPDGKKITFDSTEGGDSYAEIYMMDADGRNQARLTENKASSYHPAWNPDGKKIAFTLERDGNHGIYIMDADGRNQFCFKTIGTSPTWSSDGKRMAFESTEETNSKSEIYVIDADGRNQARLTENKKNNRGNFEPAWGPVSFPEISALFATEVSK